MICARTFECVLPHGHREPCRFDVYTIPNMYQGCTLIGLGMGHKHAKYIPHFHCPHCGAIAHLHCQNDKCIGCDACFGEGKFS